MCNVIMLDNSTEGKGDCNTMLIVKTHLVTECLVLVAKILSWEMGKENETYTSHKMFACAISWEI